MSTAAVASPPMKLFYGAISPFVRKVLVVAHERGIAGRIELVNAQPSPIARDTSITAHNPSGKIPTLLLADGTALYDSRVIVEYLDSLPGGPRLIPDGPARWLTLTLQSLADEMTDALVLLRYETALRPAPQRWPEWVAGQWDKINASLDVIERQWLAQLQRGVDVGAIAVATSLGYLELRFPEAAWRATRPGLARWYEAFAERPSMKETAAPQQS